jgi:hypothetical protein
MEIREEGIRIPTSSDLITPTLNSFQFNSIQFNSTQLTNAYF